MQYLNLGFRGHITAHIVEQPPLLAGLQKLRQPDLRILRRFQLEPKCCIAVLHSPHSGVDGQLCMALCLQMQDSGTIFLRCGGKIHKGLLILPLLCLHHIGRKRSKGHIRCCSPHRWAHCRPAFQSRPRSRKKQA